MFRNIHIAILVMLAFALNSPGKPVNTQLQIHDVSAVRTADNTVTLMWNVPPDGDTVGFMVYRTQGSTPKKRLLTPNPLPSPSSPRDSRRIIFKDSDNTKIPADATYMLEGINRKGEITTHGPFPISTGQAITTFSSNIQQAPEPPELLSVGSPGDRVKITISEEGFYQLNDDTIANSLQGLSSSDIQTLIQATGLVITCQGHEIPWQAWSGNGGLNFYAIPTNNTYTSDNVYWLQPGIGTRIDTTNSAPTLPASTSLTYSQTDHWEENVVAFNGLFTDPNVDTWFWSVIRSWVSSLDEATFAFTTDHVQTNALGQREGNVSVFLQGYNSAPVQHSAEISVNGESYTSNVWVGATATNFTVAVTNLIEGSNTLSVKGYNIESGWSIFFVDSFDVTYSRQFMPSNDILRCDSGTHPVITIDGFSTNTITVLDITDPMHPSIISGTMIDMGTSGTYRVSFTPASPNQIYYAVAGPLPAPASVKGRNLPDLLSSTNAATHLTIAAPGFESTAQQLSDYRASQGLSTMLVGIEDIFDVFSQGLKTPWAIRSFLSSSTNWATPPKFVVLAGSGSYDYKNYRGFNDSMIPPAMVNIPAYGLRASDAPLANWSGGGAPELALGRLHCQSTQELAGIIAKIQAFEGDAEWKSHVHFVADNYDPDAGDFSASSSNTAAVIPTNQYTITPNYLDTQSVSTVNSRLVDAFNNGSYIISYFGHGNPDQLTDERILYLTDLNSLTNAATPPIMTAMTCDFVYFGYPGAERLGEGLLGRSHGGVSAIWGCVAPTYNYASETLSEYFFSEVFEDQTIRLGDAIVNALKEYELSGTLPYVLDAMCLLGDPATAMPPPGYSFGSWQSLFFSPEQLADPVISGPSADPDGDGIVNLSEFSNNGNPTNAEAITEFEAWIETIDAGGGYTNDFATASFRQRQLREGVETLIESCTNLVYQSWKSGPAVTYPLEIVPIDDVLEEVTVRVMPALTTNQQQFIRLKIQLSN